MATFCSKCGTRIEENQTDCPSCGAKINTEQPIIINVENNTTNVNTNSKKISKWKAFFLCLFLGGIGIHKFYEGRALMGVLYLFTGGLLGIGCFIDLILILTKPNPYYV